MTVELQQRYHDLLHVDGLAEESSALLDRGLRQRNLVFGERPLCTVLRPRFVTPEELAEWGRRLTPLMSAFRKAHERALTDTAFRAQFNLLEWEEILIADDPGYPEYSPTGRLDIFATPGAAQTALTEFNAETPAGAAFNDALAEVFLDLPVIRRFAEHAWFWPLPARHGVIGAMLRAYQTFAGRRVSPRVAILDWDGVATHAEFVLFQQALHGLGIECVIGDPRATEYRNGALWLAGAKVDLIYKRVLIEELVEQCGLESPVVRAVRDRAVCMVNPFRCKILHKKASLAVLSDDANVGMFDADERRAIAQCIPWTRNVVAGMTMVRGKRVDLPEYIAVNREQLVLKPNDDYGGAGITLGWTASSVEWEIAIQRALSEPYIVQERVTIPSEPYPSFSDGTVHVIDRMLDTAPFITDGRAMEGCLTRLSTAALLNVTAGGGSQVPTFVAMPR